MFKRPYFFAIFFGNCTWGTHGELPVIYRIPCTSQYVIQGLLYISFWAPSKHFPWCIQLCPIVIVHPESGSSQPFTLAAASCCCLPNNIKCIVIVANILLDVWDMSHRALCYSSYLVEFYFTQNWKCQKLKSEFLKVLIINGANFQKVKNWQNVNFYIGDMYLERAEGHEWGEEGQTDSYWYDHTEL